MLSAHGLIVIDIFAMSFQNATNPLKVIEQTCNTVIQCLTMNYDLEPWSNIRTTNYELTFVLELFVNPTRGSKVIERHESVTDRRTDRQTDGQTDGRSDIQTDKQIDGQQS